MSEPWSDQEGARRARELFESTYGAPPDLVTAAPGRVNLIGEHTDYNAGLCLPIAIPHATYAAVAGRDDSRFRFISAESGEPWEGKAGDLGTAQDWAAYAAGVVWAMAEAGHSTTGLDVAVTSSVPIGAGLSSSAALECSVGLGVAELIEIPAGSARDRLLVETGIRAENEVAGAATGGLDQTAAVLGEPETALLLDCASWESRPVGYAPQAAGLALLVVDTRVHHTLNDGGYGSRRDECEAAARALGLKTLREATESDLDRLDDDVLRRRVRHVVTEIQRVADTVVALESPRGPDWEAVGDLMLASHASMRDDFEISCPELDLVVEVARAEGAFGSRMTGGGFGGSAIVLAPADRTEQIRGAVTEAFAEHGYRAPDHLDAPPAAGARLVS